MLSTSKLIALVAALALLAVGVWFYVRPAPGDARDERRGDAGGGTAASAPSTDPEAPPRRPIKRVILLTIDTLRADVLPIYGNTRVATPNLSAIADQSVVFDNAYASSPWTRPTAVSMMSGLPSGIHGAAVKEIEVEAVLPDSLPMLAEYMKRAGYHTGAIGYNPFLSRSPNLERGFDRFDMFPRFGPNGAKHGREDDPVLTLENTTEVLTTLALNYIDRHAGDDFFLWLHYYDPHNPYVPPRSAFESLSRQPLPDDDEKYFEKIRALNRDMELFLRLERMRLDATITASGLQKLKEVVVGIRKWVPWLRDFYLAEVQHVDHAIGRVVEKLKALDLYDDTLIVVTSDHGEEWGDHGKLEHGHSLYQELVHVPFFVKRPQSTSGARLTESVSIVSVMPTLLELCGITSLNPAIYSPSLAEAILRGKEPDASTYFVFDSVMYGEPRVSVLSGTMKYIRRNGTMIEELYDLAADPKERNNLASDAGQAEALTNARSYLEEHEAWCERFKKKLWDGEVKLTRPDEEAKKLLRSHGYLK